MIKQQLLKLILVLIFTGGISTYSHGQCTDGNSNTTNTNFATGNLANSFVADCSGNLTSVELQWGGADTSFSIELFEGNGTGGTQVGTSVTGLASAGSGLNNFESFDVSSGGFSVTSGNTYTIQVSAANNLIYDQSGGSAFSEGILYFNGGAQSTLDMVFRVNVTAAASTPEVTLSSSATSALETGGSITVTATASSAPSSDLTVPLQFTGTATTGVDYTGSGDITISGGSTTGSITLNMTSDVIYEPGGESLNVAINSTTISGATVGSPSSVALTITDDDSQPTITINDVTQNEGIAGTTNFTFTISLSNPSSETIGVNYASADGSALAGVDYTSVSGSLSFTPGQTSKIVTVLVNGETLDENDETFTVNLSSPTNATISDASGTGTISNDDTAFQPNASLEVLSIYNPITDESGGQVYVRGKLDRISGKTVDIPLSFSGTAVGGGTDYSITSSTITLTSGEIMDSIRITSLFDGIEEGDETIIIDMDVPTNSIESGTQQVTITIQDEDAAAPVVSSVNVPGNGTYIINQNLDFTVNFNENVDVVTTGGTPQLAITIGSTTRQATYISGSGSSSLVFRYTVQSGDQDADGISIGTLAANGGSIRDAFGTDANLTLNGVGNTTGILVDATGPVVSSVSVPTNNTYTQGQNLDFTVNFNENVTIASGLPQLGLTIGATARQADYVSGSGSSSILFRYTIQAGESDTDGISIGSIAANGATFRDASGNDATLTLNGVGSTTDVLVDTEAPRVTRIERQTPGSSPTNADAVTFRVTFSEDISGADLNDFEVTGPTGASIGVTGTGSIRDITISGGNMVSYEGTVTISFASGQNIADIAGNALTNMTPTVVNINTYLLDNTAPAVTSIARQNPTDTPTNADALVFRLTFNSNVTAVNDADFEVTGPTGESIGVVGSGTTYDVTVSGGDMASLNGDVTLSFASGQNITDVAGNPLVVTTPTGTNDNTYTIDNTAPTVSTLSPADNATDVSLSSNFVITFNEDVVVNSGNLTVHRVSDDGVVRTFDVTNNTIVSVSGNEVTFDNTTDLALNTEHYILLDNGAFEDEAGNAYGGIISTTAWSFTTTDETEIATNDPSVTEGNTGSSNLTFTVSLSQPAPSGGATVDYATSDGTATAGTDYTATSGTLSFAAGESSKTIDVVVSGDLMLEPDETVILTLSNPTGTNVVISDNTGTGTINDDDAAAVTIADVNANEDDGTITLTATLDAQVQGGFTVDVSTADGTATVADNDYTAVTGQTLTFVGTAGETQNITVVPTADTKLEPNENLTVSMSNLASTSLAVDITDQATITLTNDDEAMVTIADVSGNEDDGAITLTATLNAEVVGGFSVDVSTVDGTATTADGDFTAVTSETLTFSGNLGETQTFTVIPNADTKLEGNETVAVSMSNLSGTALTIDISDNAIVTINNDDTAAITIANVGGNEDDGSITMTATLNAEVQGGFKVEVATADGSASTADGDYIAITGQTLTFTGTAGETQTFTVVPTADTKYESNETFTVGLSNLTGTSLPITISDVATVTITNDDAAAVTIGDVSANEDDGTITLTATLDAQVQGGFTVDVSTADGTATVADNDYTALTSRTLTFAGTAGETQAFTIAPISDIKVEVDETFSVSMSNLASTSLAVDITDQATITLTNDDEAMVTISDVSGNEDDGAITLTATLNAEVVGGFSVDVSTADGTATTADADYTPISNQKLTFAGNEGETQTFTLTPTADTKVEIDESVNISLSNLSGTSLPIDITDGAVVTILNDDITEIQFTSTEGNGSEAISSHQFAVELTRSAAIPVTVDYSVTGTATGSGTDYTLTNGTLTIAAGNTSGTLEITGIVDDEIVEQNETVIVTLANPNNAILGTTTMYTYTITDNDEAVLSLEATDQAAEDDVNGLFTISSTKQFANEVNLTFSISGTATESNDYEAIGTSIVFPSLTSSITIPVVVRADNEVEEDETVQLSLESVSNTSASIAAESTATITITDNDDQLPQTITFNPIDDKRLSDREVVLEATGGDSNEPITFTISTDPVNGVATLSNEVILLEGVGTVTVTASQAGNNSYLPAEDVSQSFSILSDELLLPTLFTPNNDRVNDLLLIRGGASVQSISFRIYNREGNLVFESDSFQELTEIGWDGKKNGVNQPTGAYVWVIAGTMTNGQPITINGSNKGTIFIAR
ncbi:hypothetical protein GCM10027429_12250 [Marivirga atlantica]|jgi:gliding motility-associated-like protein|uniref:Ig-like domain-containing protein n=1 Tax=Marivirga atlantica TaxID=1548457 RepID=A0A937DGJ0_9BACT|nr:Calx-beta domain-containing protein [Marivirga atlantica]MBL0764838.1 Ig-like domain-containing protein [Marivirga atlantica]